MNEAAAALEEAVNSAHRGTQIAVWVVIASIAYLMIRIIGS